MWLYKHQSPWLLILGTLIALIGGCDGILCYVCHWMTTYTGPKVKHLTDKCQRSLEVDEHVVLTACQPGDRCAYYHYSDGEKQSWFRSCERDCESYSSVTARMTCCDLDLCNAEERGMSSGASTLTVAPTALLALLVASTCIYTLYHIPRTLITTDKG